MDIRILISCLLGRIFLSWWVNGGRSTEVIVTGKLAAWVGERSRDFQPEEDCIKETSSIVVI